MIEIVTNDKLAISGYTTSRQLYELSSCFLQILLSYKHSHRLIVLKHVVVISSRHSVSWREECSVGLVRVTASRTCTRTDLLTFTSICRLQSRAVPLVT